jgi:hypothetical protein
MPVVDCLVLEATADKAEVFLGVDLTLTDVRAIHD